MWEDPIVAEVHRIRQQMLAECGGSLRKLMDYLQRCEQEHPERLVTLEEFRRRYPKKNLRAPS